MSPAMYLRGGSVNSVVCPSSAVATTTTTLAAANNMFSGGFYPSLLPAQHISAYYPMAALAAAKGLVGCGATVGGQLGGCFEVPAQIRKLFIGGLNHETDDNQVIFKALFLLNQSISQFFLNIFLKSFNFEIKH